MAATRISEAEAIRTIKDLLERVYQGEEILIENDAAPAVVLRLAMESSPGQFSASPRLTHEGELISPWPDFAARLRAIFGDRVLPAVEMLIADREDRF